MSQWGMCLPHTTSTLAYCQWTVGIETSQSLPPIICMHIYTIHTHSSNQRTYFILKFLSVNAVHAKLYVQLCLFLWGEREAYLVWASINNSHSTFRQHFKTPFLIVKSISRRGEEKKSLKYQVVQLSNEALMIQNLQFAFTFQRSPARGLSLRMA